MIFIANYDNIYSKEKDMDSNKIGKRISEFRKKENLSQKDLARKLCVSNKTVSKWECGNGVPDIEMSNQIAKIFGISIDKLINDNTINEAVIEKLHNEDKMFFKRKNMLTILLTSMSLVLICITLLCYFFIPRMPVITSSNIFTINNSSSTLSCSVSNPTSFFSFNDTINIPLMNNWKLYNDINGKNEISSKTVNLEIGDNIFYIVVENSSSSKKVYTVNIRRKPIYTVIFTSNGATITTQTVEEDSIATVPTNPTKTGYNFVCWDKNINQIIVENIEFTALFTPINYIITYELNGGENNPNNPDSFTIENNITLNNATKEGYIFNGWFDDEKLTNRVTSIKNGAHENKKFYAGFFELDNNNNVLIKNATELKSFASSFVCWGNKVLLTADIDLGGMEWTPIGDSYTRFTGVFDGGGYKISNFKITTNQSEYSGLFGQVRNGIVKNLGVENFNINKGEIIGGLIAFLVGNSSIINCSINCNINVNHYENLIIGGMVGMIISEGNTISISNCYSNGSIVAIGYNGSKCGGLIGTIYHRLNSNINISSCYSTEDITITDYKNNVKYDETTAGGLIGKTGYVFGYVDTTVSLIISDCYAIGNVFAKGFSEEYSLSAGLIGFNEGDGTITNCYRYSGQVLTQYETVGTGSNSLGTSADMTTIWTFVYNNWDNDIWNLNTTANPTLK